MCARERWPLDFAGFVLMLVLSLGLGSPALAQSEETIPADEAVDHVGEEATVCGNVVETAHITDMEGEPTFLNFGEEYPDQVFSVVIYGDDRVKFRRSPDRLFRYRLVCATGTIELADTGIRMIVSDPEAIEIVEEDPEQ